MSDDVVELFIKQTMPDMKKEYDRVKELIWKHKQSGTLLFICDAYDEMLDTKVESEPAARKQASYTIEDLLNDHTTHILVSTRPSQIKEIKLLAMLTIKARIKGLTEEQALQLITNYCSIIGITTTPTKILEELKKKNLLSLSRSPQQLQLVCSFLQDKQEISRSLTILYDDFYDRNLDNVLMKLQHEPISDKSLQTDLLENHDKLFHDLQKLALTGFVEGTLIYDARKYLEIEQQRCTKVFQKTGMVYFEESVGGGKQVLGFGHKTFQEYFGAKFLNKHLYQPGTQEPLVIEVLKQWKNIRQAMRYERMFVFLAGMIRDEESARKLMGHINQIILKLPELFHAEVEATIDLHDLDDVPRQLAMLQVKCALEMTAVNEDTDSEYIQNLMKQVNYSETMPLPDVNVAHEEEDEVGLEASVKPPASKIVSGVKKIKPLTGSRGQKGQSSTKSSTAAIQSGESTSTIVDHVNSNTERAYCFRTMCMKNKCDVRVDCLVLPESMLDVQYPPFKGSRQCFFTSSIAGGLGYILANYTAVDLLVADCTMIDVHNAIGAMSQFYPHTTRKRGIITTHAMYADFNTCHMFRIRHDIMKDCEYVDCNGEVETTSTAISQLLETSHEPQFKHLCLQQWACQDPALLQRFSQNVKNKTLRMEKCKS
eukprot:GHVT01091273.1.p1 GENE.GHVT01091273.1~~GHVT01091273.1.p1  ORF type:complete len:722 (+),score=23.16 GHVT01091273.1:203-2167(+)